MIIWRTSLIVWPFFVPYSGTWQDPVPGVPGDALFKERVAFASLYKLPYYLRLLLVNLIPTRKVRLGINCVLGRAMGRLN